MAYVLRRLRGYVRFSLAWLCVQHGVKGLFEQANYSPGNGEMGPLRAYLLAEVLWHPDADVPKLTTEFLRAYYRPAAPKLQAYLDLLQAQVRDGKTWLYR